MTGNLYINGKNAWTQWGAFLEDGSADKLFLPAPAKPLIENKSRAEHGKEVLMKAAKYDERDLSLVFCFANTGTSFNERLTSLVTDLLTGTYDDQLEIQVLSTIGFKQYNPAWEYAYRTNYFTVTYISCTELNSVRDEAGKVVIRLNEPNPNDRILLQSHYDD